ncbi:hypothetical protein [Faecalibaculum rodentium]|uniref:hypothetical protein n=1 Tax=Faecalibaculum rodentium TaxID=1702221 RepID=UPI003F662A58
MWGMYGSCGGNFVEAAERADDYQEYRKLGKKEAGSPTLAEHPGTEKAWWMSSS